jgi:hypothetical protein
MADTKISALTAAGAAAAANEFAINEAGTSKKVTAAQIKTLVNTAPLWAAGTASANTWPRRTSGTLLTTPEDGAEEFANDCFYGTPKAQNRGVYSIEHWIRQASSRTLTSTTSAQKLFDAVTNGTLDLAAGVYFFQCLFGITGLSGTSGNLQFQLLGGGGATLGTTLYRAVGIDQGTIGNAGTITGSRAAASNSAASILTAGTGTSAWVEVTGTFDVTAAGTIIPSVALVTAAAGTVEAGSFFTCRRVGPTGAVSVGKWS